MGNTVRQWPTSALDAAQRAFDWLCCEPGPLCLDVSGIEDLPGRPVPVGQLRSLLLRPTTPLAARDGVWRLVVLQTRSGSGAAAWTVAAAGLAIPGLRRAAGRLALGYGREAADLDAEVLAGFLTALRRVDPDGRRLCQRLIRAGAAAGRALRYANTAYVLPRTEMPESRAPRRPYGHPDLVLGQAVSAGLLSAAEADVIGRTRLDEVPIAQIAAEQAVGVRTAVSRRWRAERRLAAALRSGRLETVRVAGDADPVGLA